jgi:hypothetical protein
VRRVTRCLTLSNAAQSSRRRLAESASGGTLEAVVDLGGPLKTLLAVAALAFALVAPAAAAVQTTAAMPALYKNCTNLNKKYPHGVGRVGARDKTSGVPVTTFRRSNRIFAVAMSWNRGLDRDKDRIACEKK